MVSAETFPHHKVSGVIPKGGFPISRLALMSSPATVKDAAFEAVPFNVSTFLRSLHWENARDVDAKWKWDHPRLGTVAKFLGKVIGPEKAHDLMIIIDRIPRIEKEHDPSLRKRYLSLKLYEHGDRDPHFHIANFLQDILITGEIPALFLKREPNKEYLLELSKIWLDELYLQLETLLYTGSVDLDHQKVRPDLTGLSVRKRVSLMERNALLQRQRKIKSLKSSIKLIENTI